MNIKDLKDQLTDNVKDIKLNLSIIMTEEGAPDLSQKQIYLIALAVAYATKSTVLISAMQADALYILDESEMKAAHSAASIMAMNNIYYRFIHMVSDKSFATVPAKLRMNVIGNSGISKIDFELACLAVSALNGCGMCIDAHTAELVKNNVTKLAIQSAVRIAAVLNGVVVSLQ